MYMLRGGYNAVRLRMIKSKSGVLIQFATVLLLIAFHFYWTWPTYALNLLYKEADASVNALPDSTLQIRFFNEFEHQDMSFTRPLWTGEKGHPTGPMLRVRYAWSRPDALVIYGLDKVPALWLPVLVHLACLFTIIAMGKGQ